VANLGSSFYSKLVEIASETGMKPEDILAIMVSESGINPQARNPNGGATGLVQFMPGVLKGLGFKGDPQDFGTLSGEDQLPYVKKLIENNMQLNGGPFTSAAQYYVAIFWPVGLKLPGVRRGDPKTAIVEEHPATVTDPQSGKEYSKKYYDLGFKINPQFESLAYRSNPLFHGETPGAITYGDMMKQVEKNKENPLYSKALIAMNQQTGYQPGAEQPSMLAQKEKTMPTNNPSSMSELLEKFVQSLSSVTASKKTYQKFLPNHHVLIEIDAADYTSAVEFSRVLCAALDEELKAFAYPHSDGGKVEVECSIAGPALECLQTVEQLSQALASVFKDATKKIGGITVQTNCIMNKKSSYQQISLRTADTNYRKFLLKFV
jgi:Transglycosylase SLT domain